MSGISTAATGDVTLAGDNVFTGTNSFNSNRPTSTIATTPSSTDFITKQNGEALFAPVSVDGDVKLNGNPNAFTGTNTFNSNRPTSTIATTPSSTDFITKQNADDLYAPVSVDGDVTQSGANGFTGTNTFNTNRPTSTIATTPSSTDFITKQNADALYGGLNIPTKQEPNATVTLTVTSGNPTAPSNAWVYGYDNGGSVTSLKQTVDFTTGSKIIISVCIMGEWSSNEWEKGVILVRRETGDSSTSVYLRATAAGSRGLWCGQFLMAWGGETGGDHGSTMESCIFNYIDTPTTGKSYDYMPVLVNTENNSSNFNLNRCQMTNNFIFFERGISTMTLLKI